MTTPVAASTAPARRFDMYAGIHKALRACMGDTLAGLGRMDVHDAAERDAALAQARETLDLLARHVHHEDAFVHPVLAAVGHRAESVGDHPHHLEEIAELHGLVDAVEHAPAEQADARAHALYLRFARFVADNFEHMHVEETANNAVLWAHYTDAELMAVEQRLVASIAPPVMMSIMAWMLPALNRAELHGLLGGIRETAPPEAFAGLMALACDRLPAARWQGLQRAMAAAAPVPACA